jgi:hypothetical protein
MLQFSKMKTMFRKLDFLPSSVKRMRRNSTVGPIKWSVLKMKCSDERSTQNLEISVFVFVTLSSNNQQQEGQSTYNAESPSQNHCCSGRAVSTTYLCVHARVSACVREWCLWVCTYAGVCLLTYPAKRIHHIVIGSLSVSTIFFDIIS